MPTACWYLYIQISFLSNDLHRILLVVMRGRGSHEILYGNYVRYIVIMSYDLCSEVHCGTAVYTTNIVFFKYSDEAELPPYIVQNTTLLALLPSSRGARAFRYDNNNNNNYNKHHTTTKIKTTYYILCCFPLCGSIKSIKKVFLRIIVIVINYYRLNEE